MELQSETNCESDVINGKQLDICIIGITWSEEYHNEVCNVFKLALNGSNS